MAVSWAAGVNTDAYGMETDGGDNVERIEFESGKTRTYLKTLHQKYTRSCCLWMTWGWIGV